MHQKDAVKQAWLDAGLYQSKDAKLQEFLKKLDDVPLNCWPEFIDDCRRNYPDYKAKLVGPIWDSGDKLLRLNLIRSADTTLADEVALLQKFARKCDPAQDQAELKAIVLKQDPQLAQQVRRIRNLPADIKAALNPVAVVPADAQQAPQAAKSQKKAGSQQKAGTVPK